MAAFYKDNDHQATEEESIKVIHQAIDSGITMLDTSDMYGPYTNEELVGELFYLATACNVQCDLVVPLPIGLC